MLPDSYDKVSEETKMVVQLLLARAIGFLQGSGKSDGEARNIMDAIEKEAMENAVEMAVEVWVESRKACSAEQFVQRFADLVWEKATGDDDRPWPYEFSAPVDGVPLSREFLEAVGTTEEEVLGNSCIKKKQSPEEEANLELRAKPARQDSSALQLAVPNALTALGPSMMTTQVKAEPQSPNDTSALAKRKNDEPESITRKYRRGDEGHRLPPKPPTPPTPQWSGIPLTPEEVQEMNTDLMKEIWTTSIDQRVISDRGAGMFEVRILKEKAWLLLGKDIGKVITLIRRKDLKPVRLYTSDSGKFLHVGLWLRTSQTQGSDSETTSRIIVKLYHILRRWSLQAQGSGTVKSLAQSLADELKA